VCMKPFVHALVTNNMSILKYVSSVSVALFFAATTASGQTASPACDDPSRGSQRCLPWGYLELTSQLGSDSIYDLSKDGSIVAGANSSNTQIFQWNVVDGKRVLDMAGTEKIITTAPILSENGAFLAGVSQPGNGDRAFRWDIYDGPNGSTDMLPDGNANGISTLFPTRSNGTVVPSGSATISADGNTIVGTGQAYDGQGAPTPSGWVYVWSGGVTSDAPQQSFSTRQFTHPQVASNASRIVGEIFDSFTFKIQAVSWQLGNAQTIAADNNSFPGAMSFDGQLVAGVKNDAGTNSRMWLWTPGAGNQDNIVSNFTPRSMTDDGEMITGSFSNGFPRIWHTSTSLLEQTPVYLSGFGLRGVPNTAGAAIVSGDGHVFTVRGTKWIANVHPLNVVALGDSYASGEGGGVFSFRSGTDVPFGNQCHRSNNAYPVLLSPPTTTPHPTTHQEPTYELQENSHPGFTWDFIACSGAATYNVRSPGAKHFGEDAQLSQDKVNGDTDLVTITIGANDALFFLIASKCLGYVSANCFNETYPNTGQTLGSLIRARIRGPLTDAVVEVYQQIKSKSLNKAAVVATGYPLLVSDTYDCLGEAGINDDEADDIREIAGLLNKQLRIAAKRAGVHFIEVAEAFNGHNVCDPSSWVMGIQVPFLVYSFHPTKEGQREYVRLLNDFFLNDARFGYASGFFASGMPRNPVAVP
jgi:GDSL-like Lipase/Acylhydrolase family